MKKNKVIFTHQIFKKRLKKDYLITLHEKNKREMLLTLRNLMNAKTRKNQLLAITLFI